MPRMEIEDIDLGEVMDIERRRQVRMAEIKHANRSSVTQDDSPFSEENMRHATKKRIALRKSDRHDIQNIGSGTRCLSCGCLHFCWVPKCGACGNAMTFNLGGHSMGRRVV
jgi:hypothetical protein